MIETMTLTDDMTERMTTSGLLPFSLKIGQIPIRWGDEAAENAVSGRWTFSLLPAAQEKSTSQSTEVFLSHWEEKFTPRTALGKRLYALRTMAINEGMNLISEAEILEEVKRRRGESEEDETDLY